MNWFACREKLKASTEAERLFRPSSTFCPHNDTRLISKLTGITLLARADVTEPSSKPSLTSTNLHPIEVLLLCISVARRFFSVCMSFGREARSNLHSSGSWRRVPGFAEKGGGLRCVYGRLGMLAAFEGRASWGCD